MKCRLSRNLIALACLLTFAGCGGPRPPAAGSDSEVKQIGIAYARFLGAHQNKSPQSREEFNAFLKSRSPADLKAMGIETPSEIFTSSRDNSEITVRYGIEVPPPQPGSPTVLAYESTGVGGKHLAVYSTGGVEEITEARLKELVPDKP
jgi:hypothetical protein